MFCSFAFLLTFEAPTSAVAAQKPHGTRDACQGKDEAAAVKQFYQGSVHCVRPRLGKMSNLYGRSKTQQCWYEKFGECEFSVDLKSYLLCLVLEYCCITTCGDSMVHVKSERRKSFVKRACRRYSEP